MRGWLFMLGLMGGCGEVHFVVAPFTPTHVEVAWAADEDLTRIRWSVNDSTSLSFELAGRPIDFGAAPHASGEYSCSTHCYQLVVRGKVAVPQNGPLIRANHASLGPFPGQPAMAVAVASSVGVKFSLAADDRTVHGDIDDWLTAGKLQRQFGYVFFPGDCQAPPDREEPDRLHPGAQELPFALAADEGRYCGRIRPLPADGGARASFTSPFEANPDVFRQELHWQPPRETAPIAWRFVADLQIADPARCDQVRTTIHDLFARALGGHELAEVDLSPGCRQDPGRALDAAALADDTKSWLAATSTNRWQRPILVYVNNLDAPLPQALVDSLGVWLASFPDAEVQPLDVALAAAGGLASFSWDIPLQFAAIEDPQLGQSIQAMAMANLPLESELHDDGDLIALMTPQAVSASAGQPWKVCQASPAIQRFSGPFPVEDAELTPLVDVGNPPGFTVMLPPKILVPAPLFAPDEVLVRWEICRRWCDHAFLDEAGAQRPSWLTTPVCVRNSVP